jgi:hypothetical protein
MAGAQILAWQGTQLSTAPALFDQPDPDLPRAVTIAWTVDDLIFSGVAYWLILDRDVLGYPTAARRVDPNLVDVTTDGIVEGINGQPVSPSDVIVFPGLHEGILSYGARELRTAFTLSDAARRFASVPLPALELHDLSEDGLSAEERLALVDDWTRARELSGVGYTNRSLEVKTHGWSSRDLQLVEARAYAAAEVARVMGIPAAMLDATAGEDAGTPVACPRQERPYLEEVTREPGRLRIAVTTTPFFGNTEHPDCVAALEDAAALLESLGHEEIQIGRAHV